MLEVDELLDRICKICEVEQSRLMKGVRGPKGNPERRFAVWAISRSTFMTQVGMDYESGMNQGYLEKSKRAFIWRTPVGGIILGELRYQLSSLAPRKIRKRVARNLVLILLDPLGKIEPAMFGCVPL